jgi:PAS domain S-box-containing protein
MEKDLRSANGRWKLIVEQMPLPFIEFSPEGKTTVWNPAAEKIFGYSAAEMLGGSCVEAIVPEEERDPVVAALSRTIEARSEVRSVNENLTKDGRRITCEWFNVPVVDSSGRLVSIVALAQEITERLNLQRQVQESQKLNSIGLLAAGVAHDFNNILTIIQGHADLVLMRDDLPAGVAEDVEHIAQVSERAAHLTRQLLAFSRKRAMFPKPLDLGALVRQATGLLDRVLGDDIRLFCDLSTEVTVVEADAAMLEQVVTNLAVNARDAMPRGGVLSLTTRRIEIDATHAARNPEAVAGAAIRLSVMDTGTGIAPDKLPRIFEPFFTTKEVGRGTGLGLSAVHGIVKQHHGWIEVRSKVGEGTRFDIFFPPSELAVEEAPSPVAEPGSEVLPETTVLLVEDDPRVRSLARDILIRGGYAVLEASDGPSAEAIWTRERDHIGLLCTDMVMPNGLNGRELAALLLESKPDLSVIYCSGYSVEIAAPGFCATDRQVFLQKPYTAAALLGAASRCLAGEAVAA